MNKWENLEAALLMFAFIVAMFVPMISVTLFEYLLKIGHPVWGVALGVLGVGSCYIATLVVWCCGYVSGMNEKEKDVRNEQHHG